MEGNFEAGKKDNKPRYAWLLPMRRSKRCQFLYLYDSVPPGYVRLLRCVCAYVCFKPTHSPTYMHTVHSCSWLILCGLVSARKIRTHYLPSSSIWIQTMVTVCACEVKCFYFCSTDAVLLGFVSVCCGRCFCCCCCYSHSKQKLQFTKWDPKKNATYCVRKTIYSNAYNAEIDEKKVTRRRRRRKKMCVVSSIFTVGQSALS